MRESTSGCPLRLLRDFDFALVFGVGRRWLIVRVGIVIPALMR
jgi:hypothetical protein